ncbi:MAG: murein L,D-transpeptidase [Burkholderiales bacterium]|jgi:murein L,D-transpeptidase YafK|nr:murein L,D-transpeptidase [Burkholderiales bacterium]
MKKRTATLIAAFLTALMAASASNAGAAAPKESARSKAAIARVTPSLQQALAKKKLGLGAPVFIRIFKESKELEVWMRAGNSDGRYALFKTYPICTYSGKLGPKLKVGDWQAPEGFYRVAASQMNPYSNYHLSFDLGYPNAYDRAQQRTGSALMVHGNCVSIGCYAMTDGGIEEIYALVDAALRGGQPAFDVHVFPFRLTDEALASYKTHRWHDFWKELKQGYDAFEKTRTPPAIAVRNKHYVVQ